jgi:hypothetical protein
MQILIDGQAVEIVPPEGGFDKIAPEISRYCGERKRVVTGYTVDGSLLPGGAEPEAKGIDAESIQKIEVSTSTIREIAAEVFRGCAEHIPNLIQGFSDAVRQFRKGDQREGMVVTENALSLWLAVQEGAESGMKALGLNWDSVVAPGSKEGDPALPAGQVLVEINRLLDETHRVMESGDTVELGDIFDYDLPPLLRAYQSALYLFAEKAMETVH